jgi:quinoprotein glucose dehydrogenase
MRCSPLKEINHDSVRNLKVAWTYHTGDADPRSNTTMECAPIVIDGVMYLTTASPTPEVVALNAATGKQLWRYDPYEQKTPYPIASGGVNRGVAYWSDGEPGGERRILHGTADGRLISLDAKTGKPDPGFGENGVADLRKGMDADLSGMLYGMTAAPAIYKDLAILGFSVNESAPAAPGDIRAYDVRTGKEAWRFHTVPRPGEFGNDTWEGESWKGRGGANAWSGVTIDEKWGIVFAGTGSPASDFYGGDRKGANLFGNCVLALDARTGKRLWHFQTVRHDLWVYDNPCPPVLCSVRRNGKTQDAVAQLTKTGFCFVFDRVTGKPLFPIEERSVPASDLPGEAAWEKQVFPLKPPPLVPQSFGPENVTDISKEARDSVLERMKSLRYGPIFTPPGLGRKTVEVPGYHGGANWSAGAFDPTTGILYANVNNIPRMHGMVKSSGDALDYQMTGYEYFSDAEGYPAIKPPWGKLVAVDLNRGEIVWETPLGEYPELTARGVPLTGTENLGGAIVTAGGLVFIGSARDEKFRAFDKKTGKLLWETKLPYGGYAAPCTYRANGRQYVVIAAGGGGKLATPSGDAYVAFALPQAIGNSE